MGYTWEAKLFAVTRRFEIIDFICGYCHFLLLVTNQDYCYTVIDTVEDFLNTFNGSIDFFLVRIIHIWTVMEGSSRFHHNLNFNLIPVLRPLLSAFKFEKLAVFHSDASFLLASESAKWVW